MSCLRLLRPRGADLPCWSQRRRFMGTQRLLLHLWGTNWPRDLRAGKAFRAVWFWPCGCRDVAPDLQGLPSGVAHSAWRGRSSQEPRGHHGLVSS